LKGRRNALVAREGIPILLACAALAGLCWYVIGWFAAIAPAIVLLILYFLFQDPRRKVPSHPLAAVSPVDGVIVSVNTIDSQVTESAAHQITIRIDSFGTYTARSPIEGALLDYHSLAASQRADTHKPGLWVRTDEGDDVVLQFHGYRFGLVPRAFSRYGERIGQGQRCAYLRLTRFADVFLPINSRINVQPGQRVMAGSDMLGTLPHP
jgi:phosphatidylserine decarboxylase